MLCTQRTPVLGCTFHSNHGFWRHFEKAMLLFVMYVHPCTNGNVVDDLDGHGFGTCVAEFKHGGEGLQEAVFDDEFKGKAGCFVSIVRHAHEDGPNMLGEVDIHHQRDQDLDAFHRN